MKPGAVRVHIKWNDLVAYGSQERWEHAVLGRDGFEFMNHVSVMSDRSPWNYVLSKKVFENSAARFIFVCGSITFWRSVFTVGGFHRKSLTEETQLIKIWNIVLRQGWILCESHACGIPENAGPQGVIHVHIQFSWSCWRMSRVLSLCCTIYVKPMMEYLSSGQSSPWKTSTFFFTLLLFVLGWRICTILHTRCLPTKC